MTDNRSSELLLDVLDRLENTAAVTTELPSGASNIHPGPVDDDRDEDVSLTVRLVGGSATRRGTRTQAGRLVQVRLDVAQTYFESQPTTWWLDVFDAVEDTLEDLGGGGRAPDGRAGGISPQYDPEEHRYVADTTVRFSTIH